MVYVCFGLGIFLVIPMAGKPALESGVTRELAAVASGGVRRAQGEPA